MKIIDKNGRLFGFINIIDLLVLIAVVGIVVVGVKKFGNNSSAANAVVKKGVITAEVSEIRKVSADAIKEGDPIYDYDKGTYIGKITEVSTKPYTEEVEYQGKWINAEVPEKYTVKMKIKADINDTKDYYEAGSIQMRVGAQQRVKNKNFAAFMTVLNVEV